MEQFLTPKEVADKLQVSYRKILDLVQLGQIKAVKIGSIYRIPESAINHYIHKHEFNSYWKDKWKY